MSVYDATNPPIVKSELDTAIQNFLTQAQVDARIPIRNVVRLANEAAWTALGTNRDANTLYWWP